VAVKTACQVKFEAVEYVKAPLSVHFLFLMVTIKLARAKQNVFFHSPSPHLTVKKSCLKKFAKNSFKK